MPLSALKALNHHIQSPAVIANQKPVIVNQKPVIASPHSQWLGRMLDNSHKLGTTQVRRQSATSPPAKAPDVAAMKKLTWHGFQPRLVCETIVTASAQQHLARESLGHAELQFY